MQIQRFHQCNYLFQCSVNNVATVVCRKNWLTWIKLRNADFKLFISFSLELWSTWALFIYYLCHCKGFCFCMKEWRQKWRHVYYSPLFALSLLCQVVVFFFLTPFPVETWVCDVLSLSTSLLSLPPPLIISPAWRRSTLIYMRTPGGAHTLSVAGGSCCTVHSSFTED